MQTIPAHHDRPFDPERKAKGVIQKKYKSGRQEKREKAFLWVSPEDTERDTALVLAHPEPKEDKSNRNSLASFTDVFPSIIQSSVVFITHITVLYHVVHWITMQKRCFSSYIW